MNRFVEIDFSTGKVHYDSTEFDLPFLLNTLIELAHREATIRVGWSGDGSTVQFSMVEADND